YAGRDAVCVTLCNELGLCDVYRTTFTINRPNVELPFFDDFSYDDVRPAADLWQDIDVLINRNFADDPPSVGVATFDAVDFDGQPYSDENGSRTPVFRDFLTSAPIALQGRSTVGLSFYAQPRGFGNRPERQDSLLVQFLDRDGNWNTVLGLGGISETVGNGTPLPFTGQTVEVATEYLYDGFQFRFAAKSSERGAVDMWHVDYVKLDDDQTFLNTQDLALVEPPDFLLKNYTSIPIRHLRAAGDGLLVDSLNFVVRNLSAGTTINVSDGRLRIFPPGQFVAARYVVDIINILSNNDVAPGQLGNGKLGLRGDAENFQNLRNYLFNDVAEDASVFLRVEYDYDSNNQGNDYADGALRRNDSISRTTYFDEYLAYDDGTAEGLLRVAPGTVVLQEYTAFAEDELTGVSIRLPRGLNPLGNQDLRLVVYAGDTIPTDLIYEEDFPVLYPEDFFSDSLQGFTTYLFDEIIDLPKGEKFYVGWEQQSASNSIGVGYDRNQQPRDVQWFRTGSSWRRLAGSTTGAIMIRPLLSGFGGFATNTDDPAPEATALVEVYPNPTNGTLHLRPRPGYDLLGMQYRLFSANGALLQGGVTRATVELGDLPAGLYLLEVSDGKVRSHHKIIRR
ncbi:MAG: T9SS type A sorting domain-containing protein, partial [Bacteroidota bacterium]